MANHATRCRVNGTAPFTYTFPLLYQTATAASAVVTLAVTTDKCWCIGAFGLLFSYAGGTFASGTITVETSPDGAAWTSRFSVDVASAGLGPVPFHKTLKFPVGHAVRITLGSGGSGVIGKLIVADYWNEADNDPSA